MENPQAEISSAVHLICCAEAPEIQKAAIEKYFTSDAGFNHPLCKVEPGPGSRKHVLGIYQWYRNLAPRLDFNIESVVYDKPNKKLTLNVRQTMHFFFPKFWTPQPGRLLVQLTLREENGLFYISQQDDYYHPEEMASLVFPPLMVPIVLLKKAAAIISNINTVAFQVLFGTWHPNQTNGVIKAGGKHS